MDWYYSENGQQKGPVSESNLRALIQRGAVRDSDLVWREGLGDWIPVSQASELAGSLGPQSATPVTAAAGGPAAADPYMPPQADGAAQPGYALQPRTAGTAIASLVCGICVLLCGVLTGIPAAAHADQWGNVVLRDDFDGPGSTPDADTWVVNQPDSSWWVQGRTFFPSPIHHPAAPFPYLSDGKCIIQHHLYNPYHLGTPKTTFLGGEIHTVMKFDPSRIYRFEARVRCNTYPSGLVTSFFTYGYDGSNSDEIDFEFLSKQTNDNSRWPAGDPVVVNTWDEGGQCPQYATDTNLDLAAWNTFRIYWHAGERVDWTWINPGVGEVLLRTETSQCLPDQAMSLYFNFWAAESDWPDAHDASLQPVGEPSMNEIHTYEIDYVEVRVPLPGLEIRRIGNDCELYWPTNVGAGFTLESTTDLNPGTIWSPVPNPVTERDDHYVVTVPINGGVVFFRLAR